MFLKCIQPIDDKAFIIFDRISSRSQHDTDRCIIFKFQLYLIQPAVNTSLENIDNIRLHPRKYNLSFRIAKTSIIFKYFRTILCQHQSDEKNSDKIPAFSFHGCHRWLIDIFFTESCYFRCVEWTWRESSHTAGVQSLITVFCPFMVLSRSHRNHMGSITEAKYRNFPAGHKLFDNHTISG